MLHWVFFLERLSSIQPPPMREVGWDPDEHKTDQPRLNLRWFYSLPPFPTLTRANGVDGASPSFSVARWTVSPQTTHPPPQPAIRQGSSAVIKQQPPVPQSWPSSPLESRNQSGSPQDTSENGSDSRSNSAVMARPKRAVSPSLSILSNGSGDADYTPSASGNRLVKLRAAPAVAQGFRPVHIPSLSAALKHHIVCPICMRKDVVTATCDEEVSLGVAGILQFRCSHCQEATIQVPTSPAIPGKRNAQLQALNLRCVLAEVVAGMSEGGCARFLGILGMPSLESRAWQRAQEAVIPNRDVGREVSGPHVDKECSETVAEAEALWQGPAGNACLHGAHSQEECPRDR